MRYEVRYNIEYILVVEADNETDAILCAEEAAADDWDKAQSTYEAEELT